MSERGAAVSRHPGWPARLGPLRVPAGVVTLRPVKLRDAAAWSAVRIRDEAQLRPWEPTSRGGWAQRHHSTAWPAVCMSLRASARRGAMLPFAIEVDGAFAGQLTLGNVVRGALRSAWIGYWVATSVTGRGVATAAVAIGLDHAFRDVGLHRVEATVRPENGGSRTVLQRNGFREEGMLLRYLNVDDAWRDHLLVATTVEEARTSRVAALVAVDRARPI